MTEPKRSQQKAKFEKAWQEGEGTKLHKGYLQYTRLDGERAPQVGMKANKFMSQFTPEEVELLTKLVSGQETELVVNKVEGKPYTTTNGQVVSSWNLESIEHISTWVEKPKPTWNGGKGKSSGGYDSLGNQIGNCITNSVNALGVGKTIEQYKEMARQLRVMGDELRAEVEGSSVANNATVQTAPPPPVQSTMSWPTANSQANTTVENPLSNLSIPFK